MAEIPGDSDDLQRRWLQAGQATRHADRAMRVAPRASFQVLMVGTADRSQNEAYFRVSELAARLGLSDRVRFLGSRRDVPDLLRQSDAFVFPSRQEGWLALSGGDGEFLAVCRVGDPRFVWDRPA